ncbi:MAG: PAS domain S-box protein, partial [Candidatus Eremiobacteraeota bacterium]|nr:PAS domain S-box protein [Candidatus Eremiobacteraeota bacterium]
MSDGLLSLFIAGVVDYAILTLDARGNVASWNAGAQRFKGYRAEEIIGRHFSIFYPPEDVAAGKPERELELAAAEGHLEDEGWRVRRDGSRFWANVVITSLHGPDGRLRGFCKVTRDLTQRRAAESALRQSEERFRMMVNAVEDYAILMLDLEGYVATWNTGAQRIKGYRAEEIVGRHFSVFYT